MPKQRVLDAIQLSANWFRLVLECGHSVKRRKKSARLPKRTTCEKCGMIAASGIDPSDTSVYR